jgi:hypothetical protein
LCRWSAGINAGETVKLFGPEEGVNVVAVNNLCDDIKGVKSPLGVRG